MNGHALHSNLVQISGIHLYSAQQAWVWNHFPIRIVIELHNCSLFCYSDHHSGRFLKCHDKLYFCFPLKI